MISLKQLQVPEPCGEDWDAMEGDARRRFCVGCGCHVHDLSAMTGQAAQELLDQANGRLCVRFQTQSDGTVLTQDAPLPSKRFTWWPPGLAAAASWVLALALAGFGPAARAEPSAHGKGVNPKASATRPAAKQTRATVGKVKGSLLPSSRTLGIVAPTPFPRTTMGAPPQPTGKPALPPPPKP